VVPYPSSQANRVPEWAVCPANAPITPAEAVHGALPDSKPGLPSFCPGLEQPPPVGLTVQVNEVLAVAPALSCTVALTVKVPAVVGVPEMTPLDALTARPGGSPVAEKVYGGVPPDADRDRLVAVPTVPVWLPGFASASAVPPLHVGSPACAGTLTASHAALTVLKSAQLPGVRFLAACSVQTRYRRYELPVVFISIALYMIWIAVLMPRPVTVELLQVGLVGWPSVGLVPSATR